MHCAGVQTPCSPLADTQRQEPVHVPFPSLLPFRSYKELSGGSHKWEVGGEGVKEHVDGLSFVGAVKGRQKRRRQYLQMFTSRPYPRFCPLAHAKQHTVNS
ncbi:hypothetical protein E2C01_085926 [Portunus trituberculatus]|uniref:Uncharacterized protein n=1 Tax=Portunus trituberculatus TaxID=210409 RepID=A0A5B7J448_PORTR|nr:hypothetical protein [Portunus trituberculatus]